MKARSGPLGRLAPGRLIPVILAAAGCCLLPAGSSYASARRATARAAARPAGVRAAPAGGALALLERAFADARAKGSFHQSLLQVTGSSHGSLEDDVTLTAGRQAIVSSDGTRATVEVIGKTAYLSGNGHAYRSYFKFTSGQISVIGSNWVSIPSTSSAFASIAYDVTVPTALAEVAPSGHLSEGARSTIDGQPVIAIDGGAPTAFAGGTSGRATLYVTATADPLPVRASVSVTQANHSKMVMTGSLSGWGEHVTVTPPKGRVLTADQVNLLAHRLAGRSISGEPGYFLVDGQQGRPVPVGRPWGRACKPVRLAVQPSVPNWIYGQVATVVGQARRQGIDVTLESRRLQWSHGSLYYRSGQSPSTAAQVDVAATGITPSTTKNRLPLQLTWNSSADADGRSDDLTSVAGSFTLPALHRDPRTVRRSVRRLIAWTQGISETTDSISGISLRSFTDRFTGADVAAMLAVSGCGRPAANTVTGIAA